MNASSDRVGAVIVAAGTSTRMSGIDKVFADVDGEPLLAKTVDAFEKCALIDDVVLVVACRSLGQGK